jgi:hypothetical protein
MAKTTLVELFCTTASRELSAGVGDRRDDVRRYWPGDLPMFHPVELLDASIRGEDPIAVTRSRRDRPRHDARTAEPGTF